MQATRNASHEKCKPREMEETKSQTWKAEENEMDWKTRLILGAQRIYLQPIDVGSVAEELM